MKNIPNVQEYMTNMPHTIGLDQPLEKAEKMMSEYRVRHLPVLDAGQLVGVITDRDLHLVESLQGVDPTVVAVEEAYTAEPYIVAPSTPIIEVCRHMMEKKYGCVLIVDNNKLVGIFTWIDALRAFTELLETRH